MIQSRVVFLKDRARTNSTGVLLYWSGSAGDRTSTPRSVIATRRRVFCPTAGAALYRRAMLDETKLASGFFDRTFFASGRRSRVAMPPRRLGGALRPGALVAHAYQANRSAEVELRRDACESPAHDAQEQLGSFLPPHAPLTMQHVARRCFEDGGRCSVRSRGDGRRKARPESSRGDDPQRARGAMVLGSVAGDLRPLKI
jgi:hypothetical protein